MRSALATASFKLASEPGLSGYLREIQSFPILSAEEELQLALRWRDRQDLEAAHKLVTSHLRLVAKIAMRYRGYGLPLRELIGEGNVGMMRAVKGFDPDRGFRLATYAIWWIRAAIQEYVLHSWSLVKMGTTAAQKTLFFNLRRLKSEMQLIEDGDLTADRVNEIATVLKVTERDVVDMNRRLAAPDYSLNAPTHSEDADERQDRLVDETASPETEVARREELTGRRALLTEALGVLKQRERHILSERRLRDEPTTLDALSRYYGISRERVRQIEFRALEKLRKRMRTQVNIQRAAAA